MTIFHSFFWAGFVSHTRINTSNSSYQRLLPRQQQHLLKFNEKKNGVLIELLYAKYWYWLASLFFILFSLYCPTAGQASILSFQQSQFCATSFQFSRKTSSCSASASWSTATPSRCFRNAILGFPGPPLVRHPITIGKTYRWWQIWPVTNQLKDIRTDD